MKKLNFEKVSTELTKEEMNAIEGGLCTPKTGATDKTGDSYYNGCWSKDPSHDTYAFDWYGCSVAAPQPVTTRTSSYMSWISNTGA